MFVKLYIENLRGIKKLTLNDLKKVNLIVGQNNSCKSSILDAMFLLTAPANADLPLRINFFRRIKEITENSWKLIFNEMDISKPIKLEGEFFNPNQRRTLIITALERYKKGINVDLINDDNSKLEKEAPDMHFSYSGIVPIVDGLELNYTLVEDDGSEKKYKSSIFSKATGLSINIPGNYKETLRGVYLNPATTFSDISTRFNQIQITKKTGSILKVLQKIEPLLTDLSLGSDGIVYCDIGLPNLIPINVMGDGLFRILAILSAILDSNNGMVYIDEIENGIHHQTQEILWASIFEMARDFNVQIVATTHSFECVNAFYNIALQKDMTEDVSLFRIEKNENQINAIRYTHADLGIALEEGWEVR